MQTTAIAMTALEWWRASGDKSRDRLRDLVRHYAVINGEGGNVDYHAKSATDALHPWEK